MIIYAQVYLSQASSEISFGKKLFTFSCMYDKLIEGQLVLALTVAGPVLAKFNNYTNKPYDKSYTMPIIGLVDISKYESVKNTLNMFLDCEKDTERLLQMRNVLRANRFNIEPVQPLEVYFDPFANMNGGELE